MTEYRIHQDINLFEIADEYAKHIQEQVDEIALDKAAETLAKYGYVKVVRCRDCMYYRPDPYLIDPGWPMYCEDTGRDMIDPDGYCAWSERRADA